MAISPHTDWRNDGGLKSSSFYKKTFAVFPVRCTDKVVIFKFYYKKFTKWEAGYTYNNENEYHIDFIENISEEEYIVRKLSDNL